MNDNDTNLPADHQDPSAPAARYNQLGSFDQAAYRLLACAPGPVFSAEAAAAILRADIHTTEKTLQELRRLALLEMGDPGWRMPGPVHAHALHVSDQHNDPAERQAAVARAVQVYLEWAAHLDTVIAPKRDRYAGAYARLPDYAADATADYAADLIEMWADTLLAAQQAAADQGLYPVVWQFAEVLTGYLTRTYDTRTWSAVVSTAMNVVTLCHDPGATARLYALDGQRYRLLGQHLEAIGRLTTAAVLARRVGDTELEATLAPETGAALIAHDQPGEALTVLQAGLALHKTLPQQPRREVQLTRMLAVAHTRLGDHDQADEYFNWVEWNIEELGDPALLSQVSADRAELALERGDHRAALALLDRAAVGPPARHPGYAPHLDCLRAAAHLQAGDLAAARQCHQNATRRAMGEELPEGLPPLKRLKELEARITEAIQHAAQEASDTDRERYG